MWRTGELGGHQEGTGAAALTIVNAQQRIRQDPSADHDGRSLCTMKEGQPVREQHRSRDARAEVAAAHSCSTDRTRALL